MWCFVADRSLSVRHHRDVSPSPDRSKDSVYKSPMALRTKDQPARLRDSGTHKSPSPLGEYRNGPENHRDDVVYKSPLGTGEMLTREEFERLQHSLRMDSGLPLPGHPAFTPVAPLLPPSVPLQHPPAVIYPTPPVAPLGQHIPPHGSVALPPQPILVPVQEQLRPFPGPHMEPPTILVPQPHQVYPQFGVPPHMPVAQPLGPPRPQGTELSGMQPPVIFQPGPPPGPAVVLPPGHARLTAPPPAPEFVRLPPR